jgi:WD40 repeat protein
VRSWKLSEKAWVVADPKGKRLLAGCSDGNVYWWAVEADEVPPAHRSTRSPKRAIAFTRDGLGGLVGSFGGFKGGGDVLLWDLQSGQVSCTFKGHTSQVRDVAILPDGKRFVSGGMDGLLLLWELGTGKPIRRYPGHPSGVTRVAVSPDGKLAFTACTDGVVRAWKLPP